MKRFLGLSLVILFPYFVILSLICIYKGYFIEAIFQNNAFLVLLTLLTLYIAALLNSVIVFIISIAKQWNSLELLRINMIIKLIHIPAYIFMFILGLIFLVTIVFPISFVFLILDVMTIVLTGIVGTSGIIRGLIEKRLSIKEAVIHAILQFVFCFDVISSIAMYIKVKYNRNIIRECFN